MAGAARLWLIGKHLGLESQKERTAHKRENSASKKFYGGKGRGLRSAACNVIGSSD